MRDDMAAHDLQDICTHVIEVAKEAGRMILSARRAAPVVTTKKNTADVVTQIDQAVESYVRKHLSTQYPAFEFMGEETYKAGDAISDRPTFIVDPIDGTSNFVHGLPDVCVSIGLLVAKQPAVGVVYNPFQDELWWAARGTGAYTQKHASNRQRLPLSAAPLQGLWSTCIGIEWGSDREGPDFDLNVQVFTKLARTVATGGRFVNSLRCTGSAAIAICRVAAGQQDAFWECGCWAWDVAAAWCILTEAKGIMVDGHPGNWNPPVDNRRYLAVRPAGDGQQQLVEEFWTVLGDNRSSYGL